MPAGYTRAIGFRFKSKDVDAPLRLGLFPPRACAGLGGSSASDDVEIVEEVVVDGHPRIVAVLRAAA